MSLCKTKFSGVYQLWLSPTHYYIGRSSDIDRRTRVHLRLLRRGDHENSYMQRVYDQYGFFNYDIIFPCTGEAAQAMEQACLSVWFKTDGCVNLNPSARFGPGMTGKRHSEETRRRIREARAQQVFTPETIEKFRQRMIGNSLGRGQAKGFEHSEETKIRMSEAQRQRWVAARNRYEET